ncbi:hypothetical protein BCR35DRAFT_298642 [Leucosporidium creatinivorum]|uniref:Arrestin-like N-terminal domain-containing protein n=1 Tax=Leucosporidium creatinivorum TaxID=106004 RepID=A0A1Y2G268_9BASI|nr:hypothetical protein BCR35DRAFT_298642 [Leucosporidium creatinivorum]
MVQLFKRHQSTLAVDLYQDTIYLSPPLSPSEPGHDEILRGTVTLNLASSRRIARIRVQLKGICSILSDYNYSTLTTLQKDLEIELGDEKLAAGEHSWNWTFIVPSSTACQERSMYGTVRHTVKAWCEGSGSWGTISAFPRPVWLVGSPCPAGELPSGLEVTVKDNSGEVGPIALQLSSPHLTVASLCFLNITFESPPNMEILSVGAYVIQSFAIHYDDPSVGVVYPPRQKKILFYADQTTPLAASTDELLDRENVGRGASIPASFESRHRRPKALVRLENGVPWSYSRIIRLLDDDHLRPTTLEHTETPLRVKHSLVTEVRYRMKGSKAEKTLECSTKVTIASCCCLQDSLLLPGYVKQRPADEPVRSFHRRCLCNRSLQDLVSEDGAALCGADSRDSSPAPPPPKLMASSNDLRLSKQRSGGGRSSASARRISRELHSAGRASGSGNASGSGAAVSAAR